MTDFAAVVALLALGAVARHVAVATARVAGRLSLSSAVATGSTAISSSAVSAWGSAVATAAILSARTGDVTDFTALVAFLTGASRSSSEASRGRFGRAVTRDVAGLAASVAGFLGLRLGTLAAQVALLATVVTSGVSLGRAVARLVGSVTALTPLVLPTTMCNCNKASARYNKQARVSKSPWNLEAFDMPCIQQRFSKWHFLQAADWETSSRRNRR
ncbi:uncharacterized protein BDZ99DRAFT_461684 [Mytilinidion resinicola]|uniref:Secreted protein n=1 Tax=Mytilinidion resinicola TaxID=574789 RepID=A0A6A6YSA4_9PEZI|nr:uncharacterized protein BDZ99DRAFT_461684 [Mytilinidion resinicola]KAF2811680.1 hypothetical protein BDZ99DRAFT_461684 [Mytilinidion resinicola]